MPDANEARASAARCQGRPRAARPGYREDMLCASSACTSLIHRGRAVPVCRIHEATYLRWGADAEQNAESRWGWTPEPAIGSSTGDEPRSLASTPA